MTTKESVNYEEFERLHVVRRLRQLVANWWKVQLNFTDDKGFLRGVPQGKFFNPANPVCAFITGRQDGFRECIQTVRRQSQIPGNLQEAPVTSLCHAGFSTLSIPIIIEQKYMGSVFADGFLLEENIEKQKSTLKRYLHQRFGNDAVTLESHVDSLPVMTKKDVSYLTELVDMVIAEVISLRKSLQESDTQVENLSKEIFGKYDFGKMLGRSRAMVQVFQLLTKVSESDATILITGENGVGKEGIAKAVHFNSRRKNAKFVIQNCGALNENLLESELFGHVKGAFTGAIKDKKGLFELADKGTLFLDEIGETTPSMQVKLLRVLQEGTFIPVGGQEQRKIDVRIVAATNRNLPFMVKEGTFREDLYYRLNVINVHVPPLRERKDDIPVLVTKFLENFAQKTKTPVKNLTPDCLRLMERHNWPGNVRELENEIERLCVLSGDTTTVEPALLSERIAPLSADSQRAPTKEAGARGEELFPLNGGPIAVVTLKEAIEDLEKRLLEATLRRNNWNKSKTARDLDMGRATLIQKCERYQLRPPHGIPDDEGQPPAHHKTQGS